MPSTIPSHELNLETINEGGASQPCEFEGWTTDIGRTTYDAVLDEPRTCGPTSLDREGSQKWRRGGGRGVVYVAIALAPRSVGSRAAILPASRLASLSRPKARYTAVFENRRNLLPRIARAVVEKWGCLV